MRCAKVLLTVLKIMFIQQHPAANNVHHFMRSGQVPCPGLGAVKLALDREGWMWKVKQYPFLLEGRDRPGCGLDRRLIIRGCSAGFGIVDGDQLLLCRGCNAGFGTVDLAIGIHCYRTAVDLAAFFLIVVVS